MEKREIALRLTLEAIERGVVLTDNHIYDETGKIEEVNEFNATQIAEFYNTLLNAFAD